MKSLREYKLTPRRLIIDLLRISDTGTISVKDLITAAEIFAFKQSAIRVTITRLVREGLLESHDRGVYSLTQATSPITDFVQAWRTGENRIKAWNGDWICIHLPKKPKQSDRQNTLKALNFLSFQEGLDNLWIRPNNLANDFEQTIQTLSAFRLESDATAFISNRFGEALEQQWCSNLWPCDQYQQKYAEALQSLKQSTKHVEKLNLEDALLETFINGSKAIHLIATDPLLPEQIMPTEDRKSLWQAMLAYDDLGRSVWSEFIDSVSQSDSVTTPPSLRRIK